VSTACNRQFDAINEFIQTHHPTDY
jgi:hypothetical protein